MFPSIEEKHRSVIHPLLQLESPAPQGTKKKSSPKGGKPVRERRADFAPKSDPSPLRRDFLLEYYCYRTQWRACSTVYDHMTCDSDSQSNITEYTYMYKYQAMSCMFICPRPKPCIACMVSINNNNSLLRKEIQYEIYKVSARRS